MSVVQVVFYLVDFIGAVEIGVTYRNENGRMKTKTKVIQGGVYSSSLSGGWDDPGYLYAGEPTEYSSWDEVPVISGEETSIKADRRERLPLNVVSNEMQWYISSGIDQPSAFLLRSVSYEGVAIGVKGDLR